MELLPSQHLELGIAEMNLSFVGRYGSSHSLFGKRIILSVQSMIHQHRGLDALNYACYQDARFMIVGTLQA